MTWETICSNIGQRTTSQIRTIWDSVDQSQDEISIKDYLCDIHDFSKIIKPKQGTNQLVSAPGILPLAKKEAVTIKLKARRLSEINKIVASEISLGWGIADHYNASLVFASHLLSCFGVFIVNLSGRSALIDVFPHLLAPQRKTKWRRESLGVTDPVRILSFEGKRIEHRHFFEFCKKLSNVSSSDNKCNEMAVISKFEFDDFSPRRNKYIYDASYWEPREDLYEAPDDIKETYDHISRQHTEDASWHSEYYADIKFAHLIRDAAAAMSREVAI